MYGSVLFGFGSGNRTLIDLFGSVRFGQSGKTLLRSVTSVYRKGSIRIMFVAQFLRFRGVRFIEL